jgi:NADH-quinone oxidoreductase subunit N
MGALWTDVTGIAFLYGASEKGTSLLTNSPLEKQLHHPCLLGLILLMVSMSFKVSAAPFHFWTPDVYDGRRPFSPLSWQQS